MILSHNLRLDELADHVAIATEDNARLKAELLQCQRDNELHLQGEVQHQQQQQESEDEELVPICPHS